MWKSTGKVLTSVGYQWRPTGRTFTLGEQCPLTRLTEPKVVPAKQTKNVSTSKSVITKKLGHIYHPLVFGLSLFKTYDGDRSRLINFVKKFIETVRFGNDHFGAIMGYRDYVIGDSVISRVYYVEGLGHNLFSVRQFCNSDLEVAFRKNSCFFRDTDGVELIKGYRGSKLYTISVEDMMKSSLICLLSKASKNKSWLWHQCLNHLNFGTINDLIRKDLVRGLPRLKFEKDYLCSACQVRKSKKHTHKPKTKNTNLEVLHTLHMDLCSPMRVQTINGKKYILVIVDDYSRFTWVKFLRSKDENPENDVVKRWNRTLVEAARTMLIFSKALMFLWTEAVATAYDLTEKMAPVQLSTGPAPTFLMLGQIKPPRIERPVSSALAVPIPVNSAGTPSPTTIDQDAHSLSQSPSSSALQSLSIHQGVAAESTLVEENLFAPVDNDPFINIFASEPTSEASSSGDVSSAESTYVTQTLHHLRKWSKDHPL
ncbi:retrovirus-related pol polyprotein from transposon TNT 1-94, partial [Tanacetum coccineum]